MNSLHPSPRLLSRSMVRVVIGAVATTLAVPACVETELDDGTDLLIDEATGQVIDEADQVTDEAPDEAADPAARAAPDPEPGDPGPDQLDPGEVVTTGSTDVAPLIGDIVINDAVGVSVSAPAEMAVGSTATACVKMQNLGRSTWTRANGYKLGSQYPQDNTRWGLNRVLLGSNDSIAPGVSKNFCFTIQAPSTTGHYPFQWKMVREGVQWFGDPSQLTYIDVVAPSNAACFHSQSVPAGIAAGQPADVVVKMRNCGTTTWTRSALYRLGSQSPQDNNRWGVSRVELPSTSVAPGSIATFRFTITAPTSSGTYDFQWKMLREGVQWFGDLTPRRSIAVGSAYPIFNPQRSLATGEVGVMSWRGRRYLSAGGQLFFPKTDFLTAVSPGSNWQRYTSLSYLSYGSSKQQTVRNALVGGYYNSIYVYTLNQDNYGDGDSVVTPYGGGSGWAFTPGNPNATRLAQWRSRLSDLIYNHGLKPFVFLAGDDSSAIRNATVAQLKAYIDDVVPVLDGLPVVWVIGLEVDEYWSADKTRQLIDHLRTRTSHKIGVHLTTTASASTSSPYRGLGDFVMLQYPTGAGDNQYAGWACSLTDGVRPYIASEYNTGSTNRSKDLGALMGRQNDPPCVAGLGNGVWLKP